MIRLRACVTALPLRRVLATTATVLRDRRIAKGQLGGRECGLSHEREQYRCNSKSVFHKSFPSPIFPLQISEQPEQFHKFRQAGKPQFGLPSANSSAGGNPGTGHAGPGSHLYWPVLRVRAWRALISSIVAMTTAMRFSSAGCVPQKLSLPPTERAASSRAKNWAPLTGS